MFCSNCGAELTSGINFCPYCGTRVEEPTLSSSLISKATSAAQSLNRYNLVLISRGTVSAVTAGDLLEDVFGYTDAESGYLIKMTPVVVGENLTAEEASIIAQLYTEYGMEVSITDEKDQYVSLPCLYDYSVFDNAGNLLTGVTAIISALTVANRIKSYRRYKKPTLFDRIFHINYNPVPAKTYQRSFRPRLDPKEPAPRKMIRKPANEPHRQFRGEPAKHTYRAPEQPKPAQPKQPAPSMIKEPARTQAHAQNKEPAKKMNTPQSNNTPKRGRR